MPPIPELHKIRTSHIIETALATISTHGCANVTMADICRAAGMSKGGLAHYYQSKKSLFMAVFKEFFQRIFQRGKETMAGYSNPLDQLLSFGWLYDANDPEATLGYPILFDFMSIAVHDDEYREIFSNWINNWIDLLKQPIIEGKKQKLFSRDMDPDSTARSISAIYQGIATRWYLSPEHHSTEWALDTLKRGVTGILTSYDHKQ
jgi:AcrR family transcriptional regulator